jgi:glycosyltransferase involved in cell wall biosynthesis
MAHLARLFCRNFASFSWLAARLEDFTLPRTAGVFCNSAHTYALVAPRATWIVPNALRTAFFENPISMRASLSPPTILIVGVITPNKRQVELLRLLASLRKHNTDFRVKFLGSCGNDAYGRTFIEKIREGSHSSWAKWLGVLDESSLIQCMDESHALIHFPLEEAFGLVVAESLARGLKLFASKVGGICDIASGVAEAELFEADDWLGLQSSLLAWIQSPSLSSSQTQQLMFSRYHPKIIASRHLEIYREVLSSNRSK